MDRAASTGPLSGFYLIAPVATVAVLYFGVSGLISGGISHGFNRTTVLLLLPAGVAILAAPGYVYAVLSYHRWRAMNRIAIIWIWVSLILGVLASAATIVASIPTGLGPILSLWSLVMASRLLLLFKARNTGLEIEK